MGRSVPHEITLLAYDHRGVLIDIVETSRHFASHHVRRWYRSDRRIYVRAFAPCMLSSGARRLLRVEAYAKGFAMLACQALERATAGVAMGSRRHVALLSAHDRRFERASIADAAGLIPMVS